MEEFIRMWKRHKFLGRKSIAWVSVLSLFSSLLLFSVWLEHTYALRQAQIDLLAGDLSSSSEAFSHLSTSIWVGKEASVGRMICRTLMGQEVHSKLHELPSEAVASFPARFLLHRALLSKEYQACLDLARLLGSEPVVQAPLYEAASLLELGRRKESQQLLGSLPAELQRTALGQRVARVLGVLDLDALAVLQDRRGTPMGWVTRNRTLKLLDGIDPDLLPLETVQTALDQDPAASVRLSLDLTLSALAKRALRGYRGSVVLLSPQTGEILAAVSDSYTRKKTTDPSFNQFREPASISKLITTTAALRAGLDPDHLISEMRCRGAVQFEGDFLYCPKPGGKLKGLNAAMASSCNIAFANLGVMLGNEAVRRELRLFGFDDSAHSALHFGHTSKHPLDDRALADLSIGLEESDITPLHAALIAAVFANGGYRVNPTLFSSRDGLLGLGSNPVREIDKEKILESAWLPVMEDAMLSVASPGGTAAGIVPENFAVAMKTGTASTPGLGYHTNYIGYGPVSEPVVAFAVRITGIRSSKVIQQCSRNVTYRLLHYLADNQDVLRVKPGDVGVSWTSSFADFEQPEG